MTHCPKCGAAHLSTGVQKCSAEAIAERAVENAECAAQIELFDLFSNAEHILISKNATFIHVGGVDLKLTERQADIIWNAVLFGAVVHPADRGTP